MERDLLHHSLCIMRERKRSMQGVRARGEGNCMERDLLHYSLCIFSFWRRWGKEILR